MIFVHLIYTASQIILDCNLPEDENVLSAYIGDDCEFCDHLMNIFDEIDPIIINNKIDLKLRKVDCEVCNCDTDLIEQYPTLIFTKDNVESKKIEGRVSREQVIQILVKYLGIEKNIFEEVKTSEENNIKKMSVTDFNKPLTGPWLVLFYDEDQQAMWILLNELKKHYQEKINIGYIHSKDIDHLQNRFEISYYPTLIGFYNGIVQRYANEYTYDYLLEFCDMLTAPLLPEINYDEFNAIIRTRSKKDPMFIVFYKNVVLANGYFKNLAHEYRFRTKIFKSNDSKLFTLAHLSRKEQEDPNLLTIAVFRPNLFHRLKISTFHYDKINEWIFHSHYPLLTRIDGHNIYSIFKGIKPVVLLITFNEEYNDLLEILSEKMHGSLPYIKYIFATLDNDLIPGFINHLLPNLALPTVVIIDPISQLYYTKIYAWNKNNFIDNVSEMIKLYENNELKTYPFIKSSRKKWMVVLLMIGLAASFYLKKLSRRKKIIYNK